MIEKAARLNAAKKGVGPLLTPVWEWPAIRYELTLPLASVDQLPADEAQRLRERPPINLYRVIANAPGCLIPFTDLLKGLYHGKISNRLQGDCDPAPGGAGAGSV